MLSFLRSSKGPIIMRRVWITSVLGLALMTACGEGGPSNFTASSSSAIAPAGSNATLVTANFPATMAPGERQVFNIQMQNSGAASPANDWTTNYYLYRRNSLWGWVNKRVVAPVTIGNNYTFPVVVTAPMTPGVTEFRAETYSAEAPDTGYFGQVVSQNITVDAAATPMWRCASTGDTLPVSVLPSAESTVQVTLQNTGTATWVSTENICLFATHSPNTNWGPDSRCVRLPRDVPAAPDAQSTITLDIPIVAPAAIGSYPFQMQMWNGDGVSFFSNTSNCVDRSINVQTSTDPLDAIVVDSSVFPSDMAPGETRNIQVQVQNTGTAPWPGDGTIRFYSRTAPSNFWGLSNYAVQTTVAPGGTYTFDVRITAPLTPQVASHMWQMYSTTDRVYFGALTNIPVTIAGTVVPSFGATVVSQNIPTAMVAGSVRTFEVTMQNTGTQDWTGTSFHLRSQNSPVSLWGPASIILGAAETVPGAVDGNGGTRVFQFTVVAPTAPGTYESRWAMLQVNGVGIFGEAAITANIVVGNSCGNGIVQPANGETCDDGNTTDNDGCSSSCQVEARFVNLSPLADRTLIGRSSNRRFANVKIGDVTNDGVAEVLVAGAEDVQTSTSVPARSLAGTVYGYTGGAGFFSSTLDLAGDGAAFRIAGVDRSQLGSTGEGNIEIADVTGDGVQDIIVSAFAEDSNGAQDSGAVYVIRGGALTGTIDLQASPLPAEVIAVIRGDQAGQKLVISAVGDMTGDGVSDLAIGMPGNDFNGNADVGGIAVFAGGMGLTGDITIGPGTATALIHGRVPGNRSGLIAAIADLNGDTVGDLLLGDPSFTPDGTRTRAGAVFGVFGPFAATMGTAQEVDLFVTAPGVQWHGAATNDREGTAIEVGQVVEDGNTEVVIGGKGYHINGAGLQVGAVSVWTGPTWAGTIDMQTADPYHRFIGGEFQAATGDTLALGDMNNDGFMDVALITPLGDTVLDGGNGTVQTFAGEAAVVFGGASVVGPGSSSSLFAGGGIQPAPLQVIGAAANDRMGIFTGSVDMGDIDGDGSADFCIGSYRGGDGRFGLTVPGRIDCIRSTW